MKKKLAGFVLALLIIAAPGVAQTAAELLQKGIFAQETEGNLDNAILIYRQIVNSAPSQRDLAAQAQYRLAQTLLQKGDMNLAAQEFSKLARDYSDYQTLVSNLVAQSSRRAAGARGPGNAPGLTEVSQNMERLKAQVAELRKTVGDNDPAVADALKALKLAEQAQEQQVARLRGGPGAAPSGAVLLAMPYDEGRPLTVRGKVVAVMFANPGMILVDPGTGTERIAFLTADAPDMVKQGFTRASLKPGDDVTVTGHRAFGEGKLEQGPQGAVFAARAATIILAGGATLFDRSKIQSAAK